jgi:hypothetical protein
LLRPDFFAFEPLLRVADFLFEAELFRDFAADERFLRDACFFAAVRRPPVDVLRPDFAFVLLFAALFRPALRPDDVPRAFVLVRLRDPSELSAVSRDTSLLKLLFCPCAVVCWCNNASPRSSNFSKKSSHEISSSESAPL